MNFLSKRSNNTYLSSIDLSNRDILLHFQHQMSNYYLNSPYHSNWIKGINASWQKETHNAQITMCELIPENSNVLEVGCGDGSVAQEIATRVQGIKYTGVDLSSDMWQERKDFNFIAARAEDLPFPSASFDVVFSMFVVEHLVFPNIFLDEAWRVLKSGGSLIIIAPDFDINAMPSEPMGFSYGSGKAKLAQGKIIDAILTFYDSRIRLPQIRLKRRKEVESGVTYFPIFVKPRCLELPEFTPDCDAIYPVMIEEVINYLQTKQDYCSSKVFSRNSSTFGLIISKT